MPAGPDPRPVSPRISVIIPSFNQGRYLERAICSVLDQGCRNLELIVIDGGSSDDSVDVLELYDADLAYWSTAWDSGPAEAINAGLRRSTGDLVVVLDADDLLQPHALTDVTRAAIDEPDTLWWIANAERIDADDQTLGRREAPTPLSLEAVLMHDAGDLPLSTAVFRREVFEHFGDFDGTLRFAYGYDLGCRLLAEDCQPGKLHSPFAMLREHDESLSATQTLALGREYIEVAAAHADALAVPDRIQLWRNCEERRRIYTLAEAETRRDAGRRLLWNQALRHPWWLTNDRYRQVLLQGGVHPQMTAPQRRAA